MTRLLSRVSLGTENLKNLHLRGPSSNSVVLGLRENWSSDSLKITKVMAVYSIDFPAKIYRRFDTAL